MVLALAAILVIAVAVPALGQTNEVAPTVTQSLSTRALAKARLALLTARSAKSQSRVAARTAGAAVNTANDAKATATATQASLDSTRIVSGLAAGSVTTESEKFVQLPGGPSVTVNVPSSGLIEVWAQATMNESGAVALYEDGQSMAGQSEECAHAPGEGALFSFPFPPGELVTVGTPASFGSCAVEGPPGSVLFQTSPGKHTYELRYEINCGCTPEVTFSKRLLRVGPRL
jgi:hypothetical protein